VELETNYGEGDIKKMHAEVESLLKIVDATG
jgi:hypothetical protein